jgi:hypothetical protein
MSGLVQESSAPGCSQKSAFDILTGREIMTLFQDHKGDRVIMQCSDKELTIDGYIMGIADDCIHLAGSPEGKGTQKYVPWPNSNIVSLEFLGKSTSGGTDYR